MRVGLVDRQVAVRVHLARSMRAHLDYEVGAVDGGTVVEAASDQAANVRARLRCRVRQKPQHDGAELSLDRQRAHRWVSGPSRSGGRVKENLGKFSKEK